MQLTIIPGFGLLSAPQLLGKAANVEHKLDIFKRLPDGHPIWVKAVEGLEEAKRQLAQMANDKPGSYFIFNSRSGLVILD
jgi:hypothetical protein